MNVVRVIGITNGDDIVVINSLGALRGVNLKGFIVSSGWRDWVEKNRGHFEACLPMGPKPNEDAIIFLGEEPENTSGDTSGNFTVAEESMFRNA